MAQVRVTFDKEFISGDKALFAKIKKPDHGYPIHHDCGDNYMTYHTPDDKPEPKTYIGADGKLYAKPITGGGFEDTDDNLKET